MVKLACFSVKFKGNMMMAKLTKKTVYFEQFNQSFYDFL